MEVKHCSNAAKFQLFQVLELGVLSRLMVMVKSDSTEEAIKALYAVSALIRNNLASQQLFYAEAGGSVLKVISLWFTIIINIIVILFVIIKLNIGN